MDTRLKKTSGRLKNESPDIYSSFYFYLINLDEYSTYLDKDKYTELHQKNPLSMLELSELERRCQKKTKLDIKTATTFLYSTYVNYIMFRKTLLELDDKNSKFDADIESKAFSAKKVSTNLMHSLKKRDIEAFYNCIHNENDNRSILEIMLSRISVSTSSVYASLGINDKYVSKNNSRSLLENSLNSKRYNDEFSRHEVTHIMGARVGKLLLIVAHMEKWQMLSYGLELALRWLTPRRLSSGGEGIHSRRGYGYTPHGPRRRK